MKRSVACIVLYTPTDEVFLGRKDPWADDTLAGLLHHPGGTIEPPETNNAAARREMGEEIGLDVWVNAHIDHYHTPKGTRLDWYECLAPSKDVQVGDDLTDGLWVPRTRSLEYIKPKLYNDWTPAIHAYFQRQPARTRQLLSRNTL